MSGGMQPCDRLAPLEAGSRLHQVAWQHPSPCKDELQFTAPCVMCTLFDTELMSYSEGDQHCLARPALPWYMFDATASQHSRAAKPPS
jgi:hypothetical protein